MSMICEIFNVPRTVGAVVGIELEVEGAKLPTEEDCSESLWKATRDGSLRNGMEYVFRAPMGSVKTKAALDEIAQIFTKCGTQPTYGFRTSSHVHVNVANLQEEEVKVIVLMYYLFEDLYLKFCSKTRQNNRFALSMKDADSIVNQVTTFILNNHIPSDNNGKYSALNMCSLARYGTLEFRSLEGTNDYVKLYTWVRAIMALRKAGKEVGTIANLRSKSANELIAVMFPTERLKNQFVKGDVERIFKMNTSLLWMALNVKD